MGYRPHGHMVKDYFCPVRLSSLRSACASLLLVLAVFTVLPRTLFHHCERALDHHEAGAQEGSGVTADRHCAICEAPAPVHEGAVALSFHVQEMELGTVVPVVLVRAGIVPAEAPRLRGPPVMA